MVSYRFLIAEAPILKCPDSAILMTGPMVKRSLFVFGVGFFCFRLLDDAGSHV